VAVRSSATVEVPAMEDKTRSKGQAELAWLKVEELV
jgi:hypothetical protein